MRFVGRMLLFSLSMLVNLATVSSAFGSDPCAHPSGPSGVVAVDDLAYITRVAVPVRIPVLANDYIAGTGTLIIDSVTAPSPSMGTVRMVDPKTLEYTPATLQDVDFTYRAKDLSQPALTASASVAIRKTGLAVTINATCVNGNCTFIAVPTETRNILNYKWTWGDSTPGQPVTLPAQVNHSYFTDGSYAVTVTVTYSTGETVTGSVTANAQFSRELTWNLLPPEGLTVSIVNISGRNTFPFGTQVLANWSPNAADCGWGCGANNFVNGGQCASDCFIASDPYRHAGTYTITLRMQEPNRVTDYPIVAEVRNATPAPNFTAQRMDPYSRVFEFTPELNDDGPEPYAILDWDFGDGTLATHPLYPQPYPGFIPKIRHTFVSSGTHNVSFTLGDADGKVGAKTKTVEVINSPPLPRMRLSCQSANILTCVFGFGASRDDGPLQEENYRWNYGDGIQDVGDSRIHTYAAEGCYPVSLMLTDDEGLSTTQTKMTHVGRSVRNPFTKLMVDSHAVTVSLGDGFRANESDLNGIAEPGEEVIVEPQWTAPPGNLPTIWAPQGASITWDNWSVQADRPRNENGAYTYTQGYADCWTAGAGSCYLLRINPIVPAIPRRTIHIDASWPEYFSGTNAPTPGSPITVHIGSSFADVPKSHWAYGHVESILHNNLTSGCGGMNYCPGSPVTRAEAATLVARGKYPGWTAVACTGQGPFLDVPCGFWAEPYITRLKNDGVVAGSGGYFRPSDATLRIELAVMVLKAKMGVSYTPPACTPEFSDIACPAYWAAAWASAAKAAGVTPGCGPSQFCPEQTANRAQAAAFIARGLNLSINKTACPGPVVYDPVP